MTTYQECKAIIELDLDPIKVKLMHKESGEGWTLEEANAIEAEYRRFLYLMKMFPNEAAAPLMDVDTFWHYHILDTMKYARDCEAIFGYFLHHFPYVGLRGEDDLAAHERMGERMRDLYEESFGEQYRLQPSPKGAAIAFSSAPGSAFGKTAFSSAPGVAFSSAPGQRLGHQASGTALSSSPAIAFSSAPGQQPGQEMLRTGFSSSPGVAFSSAPGRPPMSTEIAYSFAPGTPGVRGSLATEKIGLSLDDFYTTRPRLQTEAVA